MNKQSSINVGEQVRLRYGQHAGQLATVHEITRHANQYGSYERYHLKLADGAVEVRGVDSLEKVTDAAATSGKSRY